MVETDALKRNASRNKTKDKDDVTQNNPTVGETSREERGHEGTSDHVEDVWGP